MTPDFSSKFLQSRSSLGAPRTQLKLESKESPSPWRNGLHNLLLRKEFLRWAPFILLALATSLKCFGMSNKKEQKWNLLTEGHKKKNNIHFMPSKLNSCLISCFHQGILTRTLGMRRWKAPQATTATALKSSLKTRCTPTSLQPTNGRACVPNSLNYTLLKKSFSRTYN